MLPGSGCTIGTKMTIRDKIVPDLVGVDIGCGMECVILREQEIDLEKLDRVIHFIEANQDDTGMIYLVVHTGSRHLGLEVAQYYQTEGYRALNNSSDFDKKMLIEQYKREGRSKEIQKALKQLENTKRTSIPKELVYVDGKLFDDYIHDMQIVQDYAA